MAAGSKTQTSSKPPQRPKTRNVPATVSNAALPAGPELTAEQEEGAALSDWDEDEGDSYGVTAQSQAAKRSGKHPGALPVGRRASSIVNVRDRTVAGLSNVYAGRDLSSAHIHNSIKALGTQGIGNATQI